MTFYCNGEPIARADDVELEGVDVSDAKVWKDETFTAEVDTSGWTADMWKDVFGLIPIIRCKNCKHFLEDYWEVVDGVPLIVAHEICDFWGNGSKTAEDGWCFMAERRKEGKRNETE